MELGKRIRDRREELKLTQEELAEQLDVSRQAISKWEADLSKPSKDNLQELGRILGIVLEQEQQTKGDQKIRGQRTVACVLCVLGWGAAILFGVFFAVQRNGASGAVPENKITGVSFHDASGAEISAEAGWYHLAAETGVVVTFQGESPGTVSAYFTPSGSESAVFRQQLAVQEVPDGGADALLYLIPGENLMGHLQITLDYGSGSIASELYNVCYEKVISHQIAFPAYEIENTQDIPHYRQLSACSPFFAEIELPNGWSVGRGDGDADVPPGIGFTPLYIYENGRLLGGIGFDVFEPYTQEIPEKIYYQTVWPDLRLSSQFCWEPYTQQKEWGTGEAGIAKIHYKDPAHIREYPGMQPDAPELESMGILAYDKTLKVRIGIAFVPGAVDQAQLEAIAQSVRLTAAHRK